GRALDDDELQAVWKAARPTDMFGRYIRFLILTGCRRTEASVVVRSWQTYDIFKNPVLQLPAEITKSGRPHPIPMTKMLRALLNQCEVDARSDLYFPAE